MLGIKTETLSAKARRSALETFGNFVIANSDLAQFFRMRFGVGISTIHEALRFVGFYRTFGNGVDFC